MKNTKQNKNLIPAGNFRKLILHFNIDKTLIMRDTLGYNNTDFLVRIKNNIKNRFVKFQQI